MKKYNRMLIIDNDGKEVFNGTYSKLISIKGSRDEANDFIDECKEKGWECSSRVCYYDFEYDNPDTILSDNWFDDIRTYICYDDAADFIEAVVLKSFSTIKKVRVQFIGNYVCIVLPRKYDSVIVRHDKDDKKFFTKLLKAIYENINGKHNKTAQPKIRVAEFAPNWSTKIPYADYHEGYTFYYNTIPQEEKIDKLLKDETTVFQLAYIQN